MQTGNKTVSNRLLRDKWRYEVMVLEKNLMRLSSRLLSSKIRRSLISTEWSFDYVVCVTTPIFSGVTYCNREKIARLSAISVSVKLNCSILNAVISYNFIQVSDFLVIFN